MRPLPLRFLAVAAVSAAILVPLELIRHKVAERQARAESVVAQFASETSGPQLLVGPVLAITCEGAQGGECATRYVTPRTLDASAALAVETRRRGIFPIRLYEAKVATDVEFEWPQLPATAAGSRWGEAWLVWFVRDPRGIKAFTGGSGSPLRAGGGEQGLERFPLRQSLGRYDAAQAGRRFSVRHDAILAGTSGFELTPIADHTTLRITSNWPHPSFVRGWTPDQRDISSRGFSATWRIDSLATGGHAAWKRAIGEGRVGAEGGAGVQLFDPVNAYSLSHRAIEYGFLFILFTFTAFALLEVLAGIRLHAVQYALVGCAVAVFFLLLLALSEHIAFDAAYAIGALACVSLITAYLRPALGSRARAAGAFLAFGAMYGTLHVLLRSEDHALLFGTTLVFGLLATVMLATRRVDWTRFGRPHGPNGDATVDRRQAAEGPPLA